MIKTKKPITSDDEYNIYFLDTGIHPISKETRSHKVQLLIYSTLMILICFKFSDHSIGMLLGIKFDPEIKSVSLLPILIFISFYHLWMFKITLQKSMESWKNFKSKLANGKNEYTVKALKNVNKSEKIRDKLCDNLPKIEENIIDENLIKDLSSYTSNLKGKLNLIKSTKLPLQTLSELRANINTLQHHHEQLKNVTDQSSIHQSVNAISEATSVILPLINDVEDKYKEYEDEKNDNFDILDDSLKIGDILDEINKQNSSITSTFNRYVNDINLAADKVNDDSVILVDSLKKSSLNVDFFHFYFPYIIAPISYFAFATLYSIIKYYDI